MALFIEIKAADGSSARTRLDAGKNRLTVRLGDTYRIYDDQTGVTPPGVAVKRIDNNLVVDGLPQGPTGGEAPSVELAEFYSVCSAGSPCQLVVDGGAAGASPIVVDPGTAPIGALSDGAFVLYDPNFASSSPAAPSLSDGSMARNLMYGLGGLAVVGLAVGGGGGGSGDGGGGGVTPDSSLKLTSPRIVNDRTPVIAGEGEPGARILIRIDTDGDGVANATYGTTVGTDSRWSVDLGTVAPESGALPAGGLTAASNVGITQTSVSSVVSTIPTFILAYDGVAPAPAVLAAIATDNVVNAAERLAGIVVSGTAEAGATVTVTWGAEDRTVVVPASGQWQTAPFDAAAIPADGSYAIVATVTDPAGNVSTPAQVAVSVVTVPATLAVAQVAVDNRVNAVEAAGGISFGGNADAGAALTVVWNGIAKPVTADANGGWTVAYAPGEIPQTPGAVLDYTVSATNLVGNTAAASGSITVDVVAPATPAINPVATDNIVNQPEKAGGVSVSGSAEAGASVAVTWGTQSGSATADGSGNWVVPFGAGAIPADGPYTISAIATDVVGNVSAAAGLPVSINTAPPPLAVTSVAGGDNVVVILDAASVGFSGTAAAGATVNVSWGGLVKPVVANGAGVWSVAYTGAEVPSGDGVLVPYSLSSTNAVGNTATVTGNVYVDRVPPAAAASVLVDADNQVAVGQSYGVTGIAAVGTAVTVQIGATSVAATFAPGTGNWTAGSFLALAPGPATATVIVTEVGGNQTSSVAPFTVVPLVAIDGPGAGLAALSAEPLPATVFTDAGSATINALVPLEDRLA